MRRIFVYLFLAVDIAIFGAALFWSIQFFRPQQTSSDTYVDWKPLILPLWGLAFTFGGLAVWLRPELRKTKAKWAFIAHSFLWISAVVFLAFVVFLRFKWSNTLDEVKPGMTRREIQSILGKPDSEGGLIGEGKFLEYEMYEAWYHEEVAFFYPSVADPSTLSETDRMSRRAE